MAYSKVEIIDLEGEIWKEIDWIEGLGQPLFVSNKGRIKTGDYYTEPYWYGGCIKVYAQILAQGNVRGYRQVSFKANGRRKPYSVHRLVAIAFIPNPENKYTVNHIDSDRANNCADNLEWNTSQENIQHRWRVNPVSPNEGVNNGQTKFTEDDIRNIRQLYASGKLSQGKIGKMYGVCPAVIWAICVRKTFKSVV